MDNYSKKISERMWNQPDKGELEADRENTFIDDIVQKVHIHVLLHVFEKSRYDYTKGRYWSGLR